MINSFSMEDVAMNWPDFMDYSMFDLVMHPLASSAHVLKTKIYKHKQKVIFHLNREREYRGGL